MRPFIIFSAVIVFGAAVVFLGLSYEATYSRGMTKQPQRFEVKSGENAWVLSERLEQSGFISSRIVFLWELARERKLHSLVAGAYSLRGDFPIPEIILRISEGQTLPRDIRVTFPEGFTSHQMADRLTAAGLPGSDFIALVQHPKPEWREQFVFLSDVPAGASLEGYLFPETYYFLPNASGETIVLRLLKTFGEQVNADVRQTASVRNKDLFSAVTLASIVEDEVQSEHDRRLVSDVLLKRLAIEQPLQSDATLEYVLGGKELQHTADQTRTESPYNTYLHIGLPPGPINNPGLVSLRAAIYPESNPYFYFLSDAKTKETVFATTFEEHIRNKTAHGL